MKSIALLGIITIGLLTSCSSIYKSGQTPDDVYYSPVRGELTEDRKETNVRDEDDNYLRMKVRNNNRRWRQIDDYSYWNDTRFFYNNCNNGFNNGWNTHFNNNWSNNNFTGFYMNSGFSNFNNFNNFNNCGFNNHFWGNSFWGNNGWNYWNSPVYIFTYKNPPFKGSTSGKNVTAYRNRTYSNTNTTYTGKTGTSNSSSSSFGGLFKRVFTSGSNGSSGSSYDRPVRTFGSSSGSSTSSGSSSAGGRSGGFGSSGSSSGSSRQGRN